MQLDGTIGGGRAVMAKNSMRGKVKKRGNDEIESSTLKRVRILPCHLYQVHVKRVSVVVLISSPLDRDVGNSPSSSPF